MKTVKLALFALAVACLVALASPAGAAVMDLRVDFNDLTTTPSGWNLIANPAVTSTVHPLKDFYTGLDSGATLQVTTAFIDSSTLADPMPSWSNPAAPWVNPDVLRDYAVLTGTSSAQVTIGGLDPFTAHQLELLAVRNHSTTNTSYLANGVDGAGISSGRSSAVWNEQTYGYQAQDVMRWNRLRPNSSGQIVIDVSTVGDYAFFNGLRISKTSTMLAEPFAYNVGDLNAQGGWSGSGNWDVDDVDLVAYPAGARMTATGKQVTINGGSGESVVTLGLDSALDFNAAGNTYYVSFLLRKDAIDQTGSEYFWMTLDDSSSSKAAMGIGSGENVLLGSNTGGGFNVSSNKILGDTDYLYVAKFITSDTGNEQYFARVYGPSDAVPMTEPTSWHVSYAASVTGTANLLRLRAGQYGHYTIDEIRMGTTWGDVVAIPEPAAVVLWGLGLAGLLGFARRHRGRGSQGR